MTNQEAVVADFKRRSRRLTALVTSFVVAVVVLAGGLAISFVKVGNLGDQVTQIVQSPCQRNPAGEACANLRAKVLKNEPLQVTCIAFTKVGVPAPACATFAKRHPGLTAIAEHANGVSQADSTNPSRSGGGTQGGTNPGGGGSSGDTPSATPTPPSGSGASPSGQQPGVGGIIDGLLDQIAPDLNDQLGDVLNPPKH